MQVGGIGQGDKQGIAAALQGHHPVGLHQLAVDCLLAQVIGIDGVEIEQGKAE